MKKYQIIKNKCCCCGGIVVANYKKGAAMARAFAEECDVCPECFRAGCKVLTGEKCRVTGRGQVQLSTNEAGGDMELC